MQERKKGCRYIDLHNIMCRKERKNKEEKGRYESVSRFIIQLKENHELNAKKKIFLTDYRYIRRKQKTQALFRCTCEKKIT